MVRNDSGNYIKDSTNKSVFETKDYVHKHLLQRNRKHLQQVKPPALASGHWSSKLEMGRNWDVWQRHITGGSGHTQEIVPSGKNLF